MIVVSGILRTALRIASFALAALTLTAAFGGHIDPRIWAFPSILALVYPYLAILTLAVAVAWLIARRWITAAICGGSLLFGSAALFTNFPLGSPSEPEPGEKTFTLLTFNIAHGHDVRHRDQSTHRTLRYIVGSGADVVCTQELMGMADEGLPPIPQSLRDSLNARYPYIVHAPYTDQTVFSRFPLKVEERDERTTAWPRRWSRFTARIHGRDVTLIVVHLASYMLSREERQVISNVRGPRSARRSVAEFKGSVYGKLKAAYRERADDADQLRRQIEKTSGPLLLCGDFNDVPASWTYRIVRGEDLMDAYTQTGMGMMVTYNLFNLYFHIDQVFYRPDGGLRALSTRKGDIDSSDHYPVLARFALSPP